MQGLCATESLSNCISKASEIIQAFLIIVASLLNRFSIPSWLPYGDQTDTDQRKKEVVGGQSHHQLEM